MNCVCTAGPTSRRRGGWWWRVASDHDIVLVCAGGMSQTAVVTPGQGRLRARTIHVIQPDLTASGADTLATRYHLTSGIT